MCIRDRIYSGAHGQANGLEVIVQAGSIIQDEGLGIHFFFIGDGPEKNNLIQKANGIGLNNVSFLPPVSKAQVPSLLARADLLVHTIKKVDVLRYGMSPNKMYDYLASAKPIVTSIEARNKMCIRDSYLADNVSPFKVLKDSDHVK